MYKISFYNSETGQQEEKEFKHRSDKENFLYLMRKAGYKKSDFVIQTIISVME